MTETYKRKMVDCNGMVHDVEVEITATYVAIKVAGYNARNAGDGELEPIVLFDVYDDGIPTVHLYDDINSEEGTVVTLEGASIANLQGDDDEYPA